ncbi:MAG: 16S rRNA (adenine(1518)-N(6)/adenine(1519)-N(6))-dimethyltransferase RsmA [Phenylobacterium sp.]
MSLQARLSDRLAAHGLQANKGLGQHFLLDLNVTRKIARLSEAQEGDEVIEVGPGPGGLTQALLETGARVTAVERDGRFLPILAELGEAFPGRLKVIHDDALKVDEAALTGPDGARIVSNLPYNVGTPLLVKWLTGPFHPRSMTLMFQKEVAGRIVAGPGSPDYGRLSVLVSAVAARRLVLEAPARAFTPPPKVDSAVVHLTPREDPVRGRRLGALQAVTAAAFGQRRKMLRAGLKSLGGEALCLSAGVDPSARPETLDLAGFLRLADALLTKA